MTSLRSYLVFEFPHLVLICFDLVLQETYGKTTWFPALIWPWLICISHAQDHLQKTNTFFKQHENSVFQNSVKLLRFCKLQPFFPGQGLHQRAERGHSCCMSKDSEIVSRDNLCMYCMYSTRFKTSFSHTAIRSFEIN